LIARSADLDHLSDRVGLRDVPLNWHTEWEQSCRLLAETGLPFLRKEALEEADRVLQLPADAKRALLEAAALVRGDADLTLLVWHGYRVLFQADPDPNPYGQYIPDLQSRMGELSGMFVPLVLMGGFEPTVTAYRRYGIPDEILHATLADLRLWMNEYYKEHGKWGQANYWLYYHLSFRLFRLGRLQFCRDRFRGQVHVFRSRHSRETFLLAEGDSRLMAASEERESLLQPDDPVLDIHIPEGGKLDHEQCGESIWKAADFFARYFPSYGYRAYVCTSWLLDPQLQNLLPLFSNIIRFQKEFTLFPADGGSLEATLKRIFGRAITSLTDAPCDTSLRRAVIRHLEEGNTLQDAGGFLLRGEVAWGNGLYTQ